MIVKGVAEALAAIHAAGILHRDLKPANIMVERGIDGNWHAVVMDFGIARDSNDTGITESGTVLGTAAYMSPEQARGEIKRLDARTDIYSLGATLFDLFAGRPPFVAHSTADMIMKVIGEEAPSLRQLLPMVPQSLDTIVARCLTKDKEERYATAQALAEDISRVQRSQKIAAKKVGLLYRLTWRARQNRFAAALLLCLFAMFVGFGVYGLRLRYLAQKQAELQRQIAQNTKDLQWMVFAAHALPLHNVEEQQRLVRQRMDEVSKQLTHQGVEGIRRYMLGRGCLSLRDCKAAHQHFLQARKLGETGPELEVALGQVLGELYREGLSEARRVGDVAFVEKKQKELEAEFLNPTVKLLEHALARRQELAFDSPEYVQGLVDFYTGRYEQADAKAQLVLQSVPWMSDAVKLRGEIAHDRARSLMRAGKHVEARKLFTEAVALYERASDMSRSDGLIYTALSQAHLDFSELDRLQGRSQDHNFTAAETAASSAITALPSNATGYVEKARTLYFAANTFRAKPQQKAHWETAVLLAEHALTRRPLDYFAWDLLGNTYLRLAQIDKDAHKQRVLFEKAEQALGKAIEIAPRHPWVHNDLGSYWFERAERETEMGKDTRPLYQKAIDAGFRAIEFDQTYLFAYNTVVNSLSNYADYCLKRGLNCAFLANEATKLEEKCGLGCAKYPNFQRNLSVIWTNQALERLQFDENPLYAVNKVRQAIRNLEQQKTQTGAACLFLSYADCVEAAWKTKHGLEFSYETQQAIKRLERCKTLVSDPQHVAILESKLYVTQARALRKQKKSANTSLQAAFAATDQFIASSGVETGNSVSEEVWAERARAAFLLFAEGQRICLASAATQAAFPGAERGGAHRNQGPLCLAEALVSVEKGLAQAPDSGELWALRAVVLNAKIQGETRPDANEETESEARKSWQKALSINPLLEREYGTW